MNIISSGGLFLMHLTEGIEHWSLNDHSNTTVSSPTRMTQVYARVHPVLDPRPLANHCGKLNASTPSRNRAKTTTHAHVPYQCSSFSSLIPGLKHQSARGDIFIV